MNEDSLIGWNHTLKNLIKGEWGSMLNIKVKHNYISVTTDLEYSAHHDTYKSNSMRNEAKNVVDHKNIYSKTYSHHSEVEVGNVSEKRNMMEFVLCVDEITRRNSTKHMTICSY